MSLPQETFATESMCPDFSEHNSVLKDGQTRLDKLPKRQSGFQNLYTGFDYDRPKRSYEELKKDSSLIAVLNGNSKIDYHVFQIVDDLWSDCDAKYCIEINEKLLPKARSDDDRKRLIEILTKACLVEVLPSESSKITNEELLSSFFQMQSKLGTFPLSTAQRYHLEKARRYSSMLYPAPILISPKGSDIPKNELDRYFQYEFFLHQFGDYFSCALRSAMLNEVLEEKGKAADWLLAALQMAESDPKCLTDGPVQLWNSSRDFNSRKNLPTRAEMTSCLINMSSRLNLGMELERIKITWTQKLRRQNLDDKAHVEMLSRISDDLRDELWTDGFEIAATNFGPVYELLKSKGWDKEASAFENQFIAENQQFSNSQCLSALDYYMDKNDEVNATRIFSLLSKSLESLLKGDESDFAFAKKKFEALSDYLNNRKTSSKTGQKFVQQMAIAVDKRCEQLQCLSLATQLCKTGWKLFEKSDADGAYKMYLSALDIRTKNLPDNDRLVGLTYLEMAQCAAMKNESTVAENHFEKAIEILKSNSIPEDTILQTSLEQFGSFLNKNNNPERAEQIYAEIRKLKAGG
jgi:hypothetical protein